MSKTAYLIGALACLLMGAAGAWPDLTGTVGFAVAGCIALGLFFFVVEDDARR